MSKAYDIGCTIRINTKATAQLVARNTKRAALAAKDATVLGAKVVGTNAAVAGVHASEAARSGFDALRDFTRGLVGAGQ